MPSANDATTTATAPAAVAMIQAFLRAATFTPLSGSGSNDSPLSSQATVRGRAKRAVCPHVRSRQRRNRGGRPAGRRLRVAALGGSRLRGAAPCRAAPACQWVVLVFAA
ncbi:hypothetical protein GCM10009751_25820 [Myceligenerans crystallogenes]|uniref:Uncharacterized protein n=1 Tax=Myceligenerans crystallogenes TaxID=316335 RepID=A0ABN2NG65_9MICO